MRNTAGQLLLFVISGLKTARHGCFCLSAFYLLHLVRYQTDDGDHEGTCQDWETDATFFHWRERYGEEKALKKMQRVFGEEYPHKGMVFAMGTHSRYPIWLINGIIRLDRNTQDLLF